MANIKISQLTPKGANLASTDLLEISESAGGGTYTTKSITGAQIRAGLQSTLTLTTTGTSGAATLVGSTLNIPQYSGGGGLSGGNIAVTKLPSGSIYSNIPYGGSNTTFNATANVIYLMPFTPSNSFTTSNLISNVSVAGAGVNFRMVLYSHSNTTGLPDVLIYESPDLSAATTGVKTATTTQTFNAGTTYWLGIYANGTFSLGGVAVASLTQIGMDNTAGQYSSINRIVTYGSAPNPFGTTHTKQATGFVRIGLTIA
jgi:hypothetical protein